MDQAPTGDTSREIPGDTVHAGSGTRRRRLMRAQARGLRPSTPTESDAFQTPQWLDRSFVLPVNAQEGNAVPNQAMPHHDDYVPEDQSPRSAPEEPRGFVRPPTPEVDFARVIQRSDHTRAATRTAIAATALAGLLLVIDLLLGSPIVLGTALACAMVAVVAFGVRLRLARAGVPHLDR